MYSEVSKREILDSIFHDLKAGMPLIWAREAVQLSEGTFYGWLNTDAKLKAEYEKVKGDFRRTLMHKILVEAPDAKYVTWYMERIAPTQFGRAKAHENRATFTTATAKTLQDPELPIIDKYNAVISDFVGQHITLEIFKMIVECLNTVCGASELPEILAMQQQIKTILDQQG